jgi:hypothetical protein
MISFSNIFAFISFSFYIYFFQVRAEKLYVEMESIEKGILELISHHGIKKLVMGAAADKRHSK